MRLACLPTLAPLLLIACGNEQDLFIGEILTRADGGRGGISSAGSGAKPMGGTSTAGTGGGADMGGITSAGGSDGSDRGGTAGVDGTSDESCRDGEEPPAGSLLHRYSFDGTGAVASDSISGADGTIVGTMVDGAGSVKMTGGSAQYVALPNGMVSALTDVTIVTWTTWLGEAAYARVFDFGSSDANYFAVMPRTGFDDQAKPGLGGEIKVPGFDTVTLASTQDVKGRNVLVGFVFRGGVSAALYLDAVRLDLQPTTIRLADIDDRNGWIGRSEYTVDPPYQGDYQEFRIYGAALNRCQLHTVLVNGREAP